MWYLTGTWNERVGPGLKWFVVVIPLLACAAVVRAPYSSVVVAAVDLAALVVIATCLRRHLGRVTPRTPRIALVKNGLMIALYGSHGLAELHTWAECRQLAKHTLDDSELLSRFTIKFPVRYEVGEREQILAAFSARLRE